MIAGIGIDLCELLRIEKLIDNESFIKRILTNKEQEQLAKLPAKKRKIEFLAGRFACKEAYSKALGTGISLDVSFQDLEILNLPNGAPYFNKTPRKDLKTHVSITHTDQTAMAFVVLECN